MKKGCFFRFIVGGTCLIGVVIPFTIFASVVSSQLNTSLNGFEENKGQITNETGIPQENILFHLKTKEAETFITTKGITYLFFREQQNKYPANHTTFFSDNRAGEPALKTYDYQRIDVDLKNASIKKANIITESPCEAVYNYFVHNPNGVRNIRLYKKVIIKNIYKGIDWVLYTTSTLTDENSFKYDFIIQPFADPNQIKLIYNGQKKIALTKDASIMASSNLGVINENKPYSYQPNDLTKTVRTNYQLKNNEVSFHVSGYDKASILVIDPKVVWSTYFAGGFGDEYPTIATDDAGNFYIFMRTFGSYPLQNAGGTTYYQGSTSNNTSGITKFDKNGKVLWSTFFGNNCMPRGINTNKNGSVYVTGYHDPGWGLTTPTPFPTKQSISAGAYYQSTNASTVLGATDVYIARFDTSGNYIWGTLYGGINTDVSIAITSDIAGNIYVGGTTLSADFPLKQKGGTSYYSAAAPSLSQTYSFLLQFSENCVQKWSTYFASSATNLSFLKSNEAGTKIYLTGQAYNSASFPTVDPGGGAYYNGLLAGINSFLTEFDTSCTINWSTRIGLANGFSKGSTIALDPAGNIYIGGTTNNTTFPLVDPGNGAYYQPTDPYGTYNWGAYILQFDPNKKLTWSTFYGGSQGEYVTGLACDKSGHLYFQGTTASNDLPIQPNASYVLTQNAYNGGSTAGYDGFLGHFDPSHKQLWSSYYGGNTLENGGMVVVDKRTQCVYYTGDIQSTSGPQIINLPGAYNKSGITASSRSAYIVKLCPSFIVVDTVTQSVCTNDSSGTGTVTPIGGTAPYTYSWSTSPVQTDSIATGLTSGTYTVLVTDANSQSVSTTVIITTPSEMLFSSSTTNASCGKNDGAVTINPTGGSTGYTYTWINTTQTTSTATGLAAGNYSVTVTDSKGCKKDTILIVANSGGPTLILNTLTDVKCTDGSDGTATVNATGGTTGYAYIWQSSSGQLSQTTATATGLSAGIYTVQVTDAGNCTSTTTISITTPPALAISTSQTPEDCSAKNGTATVSVSGGTGNSYTYSWNSIPAQITAIATALATGTYTIIVTDVNNCTQTATVQIGNTSGFIVDAGNDTTIIQGSTAQLNGTIGNTYTWTPAQGLSCTNCSDPIASPTITTTYILNVTDANGCSGTDTITIYVDIKCKDNIFIPTAFSPNGDGINDVFKARGNCLKDYLLQVYNRWGEKIFETTDITKGWDGTYRDKPEDASVFVYILKGVSQTGEQVEKKGNVTLVR